MSGYSTGTSVCHTSVCHFDGACHTRVKTDTNKHFNKWFFKNGSFLYTFTGEYQGQTKVNILNWY